MVSTLIKHGHVNADRYPLPRVIFEILCLHEELEIDSVRAATAAHMGNRDAKDLKKWAERIQGLQRED